MKAVNEKEDFHMTTRRTYSFQAGAFESDYEDKQKQLEAMMNVMNNLMPKEVEDKTMTPAVMDDFIDKMSQAGCRVCQN